MSVGEILDGSFQVYRRHFPTLLTISLVGSAAMALLLLAGTGFATAFLMLGLILVVTLVVWGALAETVNRAVREERVSAAAGLRRGLAAFLPLAGAGILVGIVYAVSTAVIGGLLAVVLMPIARQGGIAGTVVAVVVGVAAVAVFIVVWVPITFLLVPVVIVGREGPMSAIKRTWLLGNGGRLRLTGVAVAAYLIAALPAVAVQIIPFVVPGLSPRGVPGTLAGGVQPLLLAASIAVNALTTPFTLGCMVMAYYDRRVRLEGLDVELASAILEPTS